MERLLLFFRASTFPELASAVVKTRQCSSPCDSNFFCQVVLYGNIVTLFAPRKVPPPPPPPAAAPPLFCFGLVKSPMRVVSKFRSDYASAKESPRGTVKESLAPESQKSRATACHLCDL